MRLSSKRTKPSRVASDGTFEVVAYVMPKARVVQLYGRRVGERPTVSDAPNACREYFTRGDVELDGPVARVVDEVLQQKIESSAQYLLSELVTPAPPGPEELRALYEGGASIADLVRQTGYSHGTVQRKLERAGTRMRRRQYGKVGALKREGVRALTDAGWPAEKVAELLGLAPEAVCQLLAE